MSETDDIRDRLHGLAAHAQVPPLDVARLAGTAVGRRRRRKLTAAAPALALLVAAPVAVGGIGRVGDDRLVQPRPAGSAVQPDAPNAIRPALREVVQLTGWPFGTPEAEFGPRQLTVGKDITGNGDPTQAGFWSAAVAFSPVRDRQCVGSAVLTMPPATQTGDGEIRAYPSAALSLADGKVPPNGDRPTTLLDNRPYGSETIMPDGSRAYEVTELVQLWIAGQTFPSRQRTVPLGSPIVLLLRPPDLDNGRFQAVFDLSEFRPVLTVTPEPRCGLPPAKPPPGIEERVAATYLPPGYAQVPADVDDPRIRYAPRGTPPDQRQATDLLLAVVPGQTNELDAIGRRGGRSEVRARGGLRIVIVEDPASRRTWYLWNEPDGTGAELTTGAATTRAEALRVIEGLRFS